MVVKNCLRLRLKSDIAWRLGLCKPNLPTRNQKMQENHQVNDKIAAMVATVMYSIGKLVLPGTSAQDHHSPTYAQDVPQGFVPPENLLHPPRKQKFHKSHSTHEAYFL
jgi:hypothetical protein